MSNETQDKLRKNYLPDQKFKIVKEQMTTRISVTEICKKYDISTKNFYKWQNQFLKSALEGFKTTQAGPSKSELRKIDELEKSNNRMQSVISEIVQENIELKKNLGIRGLL
jgi:transposase-like protein